MTKCASVKNPSVSSPVKSPEREEGVSVLVTGEERGEGGVRFRSFCWPFASQVLGFEENQDRE